MGGIMMSIPPIGLFFTKKLPVYPSNVALVLADGVGAPSVRLTPVGHLRTIAYTEVPDAVFFDVYLNINGVCIIVKK